MPSGPSMPPADPPQIEPTADGPRVITPESNVDPATGRPAGIPQLVLLMAASCMSVLGAVLIAPVLPQVQAEFADFPGVEVLTPIVLTLPALIIGLIAPFAGVIADRFDRKRLLLIALVAYSIFGTAPLYLTSLPDILVSRALVGVAEAAIMTCATTLIGDYWSGDKRSRYLGLQTLVTTVSAVVFLGLGGALGASGWRTPFWMYLVAVVLVLPMARLIWQPAPKSSSVEAGAHRLPSMPWRLMTGPCLVTLFGGIVFYVLLVELSFVLTGVGVTSAGVIGLVSAVMALATAIGAAAFSRAAGHSPRVLLPLELAVSAVGLLLVFATTSVLVIAIGAVITGFATGMLLPTMLTWAVNRLNFEQRGRGTGLFVSAVYLGQFAAPLVVAAIALAVGGLQPALAVLAVLTLIIAAVIFRTLRRHTEPLNASRL